MCEEPSRNESNRFLQQIAVDDHAGSRWLVDVDSDAPGRSDARVLAVGNRGPSLVDSLGHAHVGHRFGPTVETRVDSRRTRRRRRCR